MHDDPGGSVGPGEEVCGALGVVGARMHRCGLVVVGDADGPHASATGHDVHAALVACMRLGCLHASTVPRPQPDVVVREPQLVSVVHRLALRDQLALPARAALDPLVGQRPRRRARRLRRVRAAPGGSRRPSRPPPRAAARAGRPRRGRRRGWRPPRRCDRAAARSRGRRGAPCRGRAPGSGRRPCRAATTARGPRPRRAACAPSGSWSPVSSARRYSGAPPVRRSPRSTGRKGAGSGTEVEVGGDRVDDCVGLLGGEAALLDRERRRVAGGVDARGAGDPAVRVDGEEAAGVGGQADERGAFEHGHADHRVGAQRLPWLDVEQARRAAPAAGCSVQSVMPRASSIARSAAPAAAPKSRERLRLGRDDAQRGVGRPRGRAGRRRP